MIEDEWWELYDGDEWPPFKVALEFFRRRGYRIVKLRSPATSDRGLGDAVVVEDEL